MDDRIQDWAELLVDYSMRVEEGDIVSISFGYPGRALAKAVYRKVLERGAYPVMDLDDEEFARIFYESVDDEQLERVPGFEEQKVEAIDCSVRIRAKQNTRELRHVDAERMQRRRKAREPLKREMIENTRWSLTLYPTKGLAQDADMAFDDYKEFVFDACVKDWAKEAEKYAPLKEIVDNGSEVRITGEDTDLTMKIGVKNGINRVGTYSAGRFNVPAGEVFTAPIRESVNGHIYFDLPLVVHGREVEGVRLTFEDGKVVDFSAEQNEDLLREQLNTDEGSRYLGELGIGTNFAIDRFTKNILFDEKIGGTVHMAIGSAYPRCLQRLVDTDDMDRHGLDADTFQQLVDDAEVALRENEGWDELYDAAGDDEQAVLDAYRERWEAMDEEAEAQQNQSAVHWDFIKDLRRDGKLIIDGEVVLENGSFVNIDTLP